MASVTANAQSRTAPAAPTASRVARPPILEGATPLRIGLRLDQRVRFAQWVEIGRRVRAHEDASLWWLGDWLNFGKKMYGRRYRRGIELTGLEYQTLRNYAMVARRFQMSRRRDKLSFHHHAELCALPTEEQERWLDRAERDRWTRNELRRQLREERLGGQSVSAVSVRLGVDVERKTRWLIAATASGLPLDAWIIHTLDTAAVHFSGDHAAGTRVALRASSGD